MNKSPTILGSTRIPADLPIESFCAPYWVWSSDYEREIRGCDSSAFALRAPNYILTKDHAEFIVKALNNHNGFLEALRAVRDAGTGNGYVGANALALVHAALNSYEGTKSAL